MASFRPITFLAAATVALGVIITELEGGVDRLTLASNPQVPGNTDSSPPGAHKRPRIKSALEGSRPPKLIVPSTDKSPASLANTKPTVKDEDLESSLPPAKRPRPGVLASINPSNRQVPGSPAGTETIAEDDTFKPSPPPAPKGSRPKGVAGGFEFKGNMPDDSIDDFSVGEEETEN
ncbi:hypothetical protein RSAG8_06378, partial [Rhizoctonia solani AG-8 WAC10335]